MSRHRYKASLVNEELMKKYCIDLEKHYHTWQYLENRSSKSEKGLKLIDFETIFPNPQRPLVIEIGSGNGDFLIQLLETDKKENIIAIEMDMKMVKKIVWRLNKREAENIAIYPGQAENLLKNHISKNSVNRFHIHFPDPWPKKKHLKRRIYQPEFLELLHGALKKEGKIITVTDFESYGYEIKELFSKSPLFKAARETDMTIHDHAVVNTNFESKALEKGSRIYYMEYIKA
jgi:tRNA (guanine-N7-)-methyltransferase